MYRTTLIMTPSIQQMIFFIENLFASNHHVQFRHILVMSMLIILKKGFFLARNAIILYITNRLIVQVKHEQ